MRKVMYLLFVVSFIAVSQAAIVKFEAEDSRVYYVSGDNWATVDYEGASGEKCITSTQEGTALSEANTRYYSFNLPAGTYNLYVRLNIDDFNLTDQAAASNDSFYLPNNSLAEDAGMVDWNGIADDALDAVNYPVINSFGWAQVQQSYSNTIRTYVMATDGTAYFKAAPREDGLYLDAFAFVTTDEEVTNEILDSFVAGNEPHDPMVLPDNGDGSSGTLQPNNEDVEVTLHFMAAGDPNTQNDPPYPVNPDVLGHYIYLSSATDPNLSLLDYVPQVHNPDPYSSDPNVSYGPFLLIHGQGKTFYWQVEEGLDDGTGSPFAAGDPNNILGSVWSFVAQGASPSILSGPDHAIADAGGNASFTVTAGALANNFRWFKVVGEQDSIGNGETDDVELSDGGIYSTVQTATLTITGAAVSDEGRFYCIAYNGIPGSGGIPSAPSNTARLWIPRLVSYYPFENIVEPNTAPDTLSGFDITLLSDDGGMDIPILAAGVPELAPDTSGLLFDNSNSGDPAHYAQYALAGVGVADYADITISVWVYWNGGGDWQRIVDFGNNTSEYIFLTPRAAGGGLRFAVNNAGEQSIDTGEPLPIGEWTYVTASLSGDTARLYVNGQLEATGTITHDPIDFSPLLNNYVGKSQWPDPYFNGMVDDLKIYNYARTTEQIAQDYLAVKGDWVCNNELYDLPYDFDGDCRIGLGDIAMLLEEWMNSYRIFPAE